MVMGKMSLMGAPLAHPNALRQPLETLAAHAEIDPAQPQGHGGIKKNIWGKQMIRTSILAAAAALALAGASAPAFAADDITKQIIDAPSPQGFRVDGALATSEVRRDPAVQGGHALRVHIPNKGANPWDASVAIPIIKPIKAGDRLLMAFWARLEQGENGATTSHLPYNAIQLTTAPYTSVMGGPVDITSEWKLYSLTGTADRDYKAGDVGGTIQLAAAKQVVDIGPVFVLDLGPAPAAEAPK
jgi:hypothetical protein